MGTTVGRAEQLWRWFTWDVSGEAVLTPFGCVLQGTVRLGLLTVDSKGDLVYAFLFGSIPKGISTRMSLGWKDFGVFYRYRASGKQRNFFHR